MAVFVNHLNVPRQGYWPEPYICLIFRVGQNHIYTVYIRYFRQGNHQIYGNIRCMYTVLANPTYFIPSVWTFPY